MAKTAVYKDGATYSVKLARQVVWRGAVLQPLPHHDMAGRVLNAIVEENGAEVVDAVAEVVG